MKRTGFSCPVAGPWVWSALQIRVAPHLFPSWMVWSPFTGPIHHLNALSSHPAGPRKKCFGPWIGSAPETGHLSLRMRIAFTLLRKLSSSDMGKQNTLHEGNGGVTSMSRSRFLPGCRKNDGETAVPGLTKEKVLCLFGNHMTILTLSPQTKESAPEKLVNRMGESLLACLLPCG